MSGRRITASAIAKGQRIRVLVKGRWATVTVERVTRSRQPVANVHVVGTRQVGRNTVTTIRELNPDDLVTLVTEAPPVKVARKPLVNDERPAGRDR